MTDRTGTGAPRARRPYAGAAMLGLAVAAALFAASRLSRTFFERPDDPSPRPSSAAAAVAARARGPALDGAAADGNTFQVVMAGGQVEAFRDGSWIAIRRGDMLTLQDLVRTAPGARAVLRIGASVEIELREKVEIRLDRISATGATVDLRRGKLVTHVGRAGDKVVITARDTETSNQGPAHFIVMAADSGRVSVAATQGTARFAARGKEVAVTQGTESHSEPGGVPAEPERIPEDVLLSVVWPEGERHAATAPVEGEVQPSSLVTVNGVPVPVSPDGRFVASVPLRDGANELEVETEDLSGRRKTSSTTLVRQAARPPKLKALPAKLWNQ
jgi:hypothetical protein